MQTAAKVLTKVNSEGDISSYFPPAKIVLHHFTPTEVLPYRPLAKTLRRIVLVML